MYQDTADNGEKLDWDRIRPVIDDVIHTLRRVDREAVLLRFFQGQSYAAIGETLNLSTDAARMRVERALGRLEGSLKRRGILSTSTLLATVMTTGAHTTIAAPSGFVALISGTALAASSPTFLSATPFIYLMATSKLTISTIGMLAAIAAGIVLFKMKEEKRAGLLLAGKQREHAAALAKLNETQQAVAAAEEARQVSEVDTHRTKASTPATSTISLAKDDSIEAGKAFFARHPHVHAAFIEMNKAAARGRYYSLYRTLAMTPAEIEVFEQLKSHGGTITRQMADGVITFSSGTAVSAEETEAKIRDLLGEDRYSKYRDYARVRVARDYAVNLASLLTSSDTPLTAVQAQQVMGIFSAGVDPNHAGKLDWEFIAREAQWILSPDQFAMLKNLQNRTQGWRQVLDATR